MSLANWHVCESCREMDNGRFFGSFTHAGTSEFVALDDGGGRSELRRPPSPSQTSRPAADHQKVEPDRLLVRSHAAADDFVPAKRRETFLSEYKPTGSSRP